MADGRHIIEEATGRRGKRLSCQWFNSAATRSDKSFEEDVKDRGRALSDVSTRLSSLAFRILSTNPATPRDVRCDSTRRGCACMWDWAVGA